MDKEKKKKFDSLFMEINSIIENVNDSDIPELIGDGILDKFLRAIAKPRDKSEKSIYNYLLKNKSRLTMLSLLRYVIQMNYSVEGNIKGKKVFVSPHYAQLYNNGVMFLQSDKRFEGLIGLYEDGKVKFAVTQRDAIAGDALGKDDFLFVDYEKVPKQLRQITYPSDKIQLESALSEIKHLLDNEVSDETEYQKLIEKNPWILGAQYETIEPLKKLNDENIPDFTGVRVRDHARDIIEIKQPFLKLFTNKQSYRSEFLQALDQCERYIDFTRNNNEYLRKEKGLNFDNPKCYLLVGYNLEPVQIRKLRQKERLNPALTILTYNDLLTMGKSTIDFFESLYKKAL